MVEMKGREGSLRCFKSIHVLDSYCPFKHHVQLKMQTFTVFFREYTLLVFVLLDGVFLDMELRQWSLQPNSVTFEISIGLTFLF